LSEKAFAGERKKKRGLWRSVRSRLVKWVSGGRGKPMTNPNWGEA